MDSYARAQSAAEAEKAMGKKPFVCSAVNWQSSSSNPLNKAYVLRTTIPPKYTLDLIKSRPPYFHSTTIPTEVCKTLANRFFPGLELRTSYTDHIFKTDPYRHLLALYDLQGCIYSRDELTFNLILTGMRHFAQYLQNDVWICTERMKTGDREAVPTMTTPHGVELISFRFIFWVVEDSTNNQYSLVWYDQVHQKAFIVDSHPGKVTASNPKYQKQMRSQIDSLITRAGLRKPVTEGVIVVDNTNRPSDRQWESSGFFVIENFRMRLLESTEVLNRRDHVGYTDWTRAGSLLNSTGEPLVKTVNLHLRTYARELGCVPAHLRWPESPLISLKEHKKYRSHAGEYHPNAAFVSSGQVLPNPSPEDDLENFRGNKGSIYGGSIFRSSQTPMTRQSSVASNRSFYPMSTVDEDRVMPSIEEDERNFSRLRLSAAPSEQRQSPIGGGGMSSSSPSMPPRESSSGPFSREVSRTPQGPSQISPLISGPDQPPTEQVGRYALRNRRIAVPKPPQAPRLPIWDEAGRGQTPITDTVTKPKLEPNWVSFDHAKRYEAWTVEKEAIEAGNSSSRQRNTGTYPGAGQSPGQGSSGRRS